MNQHLRPEPVPFIDIGAQRLVMADRQMPHRVAAVRLEPKTLGDLTGEQIAHHIFAAGGDGDVARLERRQPVGVDMGEHAGGGAELQKRDVLALCDGAGKLRLNFHDIRLGEPADQIDVVHGKVDDHADVRHPRRKWSDPGDRDRKNVLARYCRLDRGHGRIETLDMADHQGHAGAARGGNDGAPLLDCRRNRLFDKDVKVAGDARKRDLMMKMRRRGNGDRMDTLRDQLIKTGECPAADQLGRAGPMRRQGIDNSDQFDAGQASQHAGMIAAHDAGANDADPKRASACSDRGPV